MIEPDPAPLVEKWASAAGVVSQFSLGLFPAAAPPNRTCGFHRIRLSVGHAGTALMVSQGVGICAPR